MTSVQLSILNFLSSGDEFTHCGFEVIFDNNKNKRRIYLFVQDEKNDIWKYKISKYRKKKPTFMNKVIEEKFK
jgi:hypothetical protein